MLKSVLGRTAPTLMVAFWALLFAAELSVGQDTTGILKQAKQDYEAFMKKAKDLKTVSVMTMSTPGGTMTNTMTTFCKGDKSRVESKMEVPQAEGASMAMSTVESVVLNDGKAMWMASTFMPARKLTTAEYGDYRTEQQWWGGFPENAKIVGSEQYGGRDCHVVEVTLGEGESPVKAWIDKKTLGIVGGMGGVQGKQMRWVHSDFRQVEGREMPYKTEFFSGDKLVSTMTVESIEVNTGLSDDLFDAKSLSDSNKPDVEKMRSQWNSGQEG